MELNDKLAEKYKEIKKRKVVETKKWHSRHDADFKKYQLAVVERIEELKNENNRLQDEIAKREDAYAESQTLLLEERRKAQELSSEIERCRELLSERPQTHNTENGCNAISPLHAPCSSPHTMDLVKRSAKKRKRDSINGNADVHNEETIQSPGQSLRQSLLSACCRANPDTSGDGDATEGCLSKCVYQTLLESLVGVKFSVNTEIDRPCLSVTHLSSGYTFSLTLLKKDRDDGEWYYHVLSLGTLERVAHEWMREDITFSLTMCPVFFERISRVIGRR